MTTYTQFLPSMTSNFQFQATFDGASYTVIVNWSLYGLRYYVNIYTSKGTLICALPLIGSPNDYDINITSGYFATKLIYRTSTGNFEVT